MKGSFATLASAMLATLAICSPAAKNVEIRAVEDGPSYPTGAFNFYGPVVVGGPEVTISGDAKSIYEQIIAINPNYDAELGPDAGNSTEVLARRDELDERRLSKREHFECNHGREISPLSTCVEGLDYLRALGGGQAWCGANAGTCARVSCSWRCGMYLCNGNNYEYRAHCRSIAADIDRINNACGRWIVTDRVRAARGKLQFDDKHSTELSDTNC